MRSLQSLRDCPEFSGPTFGQWHSDDDGKRIAPANDVRGACRHCGCLVFTVVVDDDETQSSIEFLPEQCRHGARDGVGFVPRGDNDADADWAMLTLAGWKKMPSYAPESAAREDDREPDQEDDDSANERECEHSVVIRYIQPLLAGSPVFNNMQAAVSSITLLQNWRPPTK